MKGDNKVNRLSDNLRNLRTMHNIKQTDFEEILKIKQVTYSTYERGTREPDLDTLIKLSDFYKITVDELIR